MSHIFKKDQFLTVTGNIQFSNVVGFRMEGEKLIENESQQNIVFDLAEVGHCDSSALSLMLSWLRFAKKNHKKIYFVNIPVSLLNISEMCGLRKILTAEG